MKLALFGGTLHIESVHNGGKIFNVGCDRLMDNTGLILYKFLEYSRLYHVFDVSVRLSMRILLASLIGVLHTGRVGGACLSQPKPRVECLGWHRQCLRSAVAER